MGRFEQAEKPKVKIEILSDKSVTGKTLDYSRPAGGAVERTEQVFRLIKTVRQPTCGHGE